MNIWQTLQRARALYPDTIAVVDGGRELTYRAVHDRVSSLASFLRERGVSAGDRISVLDHNSLEFLEVYYAAAGLGAILNPLNVRLTPAEIGAITADAGSRWLVGRRELEDHVRGVAVDNVLWIGDEAAGSYDEVANRPAEFAPADVGADDPAHLYYTSGTTGEPKGVVLTHRNVTTHALAAVAELGLCDRDVWGHFAPMFHLADAWATFALTSVGGRHVMLPRFEPAAVLRAIETHRVTVTNMVPTMLNAMLATPGAAASDTSSLRLLMSGGAPIAPEVVRRLVETFRCEYVQTYGMTETSPYLTLSLLKDHLRELPADERLAYQAKTGRPFLPVELEVVDEHDRPVSPDERQVGEIRVRGETVTPGYWNRPVATAEVLRGGWLYTGDLAVIDAEGYVTIVDRKKDVIISGGENVHSVEVENTLYRHPAVHEAAVFGVPDPTWGEAVRAAVVVRDGADVAADELIEFCRRTLASFKVPRSVQFLAELPRTGSGKISKRALRGSA